MATNASLLRCSHSSLDVEISVDDDDLRKENPPLRRGSLRSPRRLTLCDRSSSDSNLLQPEQHRSSLSVDKAEYTLGCGDVVKVTWFINEDIAASDWIGLFLADECNPNNYLDEKHRGMSCGKKGSLLWNLDNVQQNFPDAETRVCFRYYHGVDGDLRAISPSLLVKNPHGLVPVQSNAVNRKPSEPMHLVQFKISEVSAKYLKKGMFFNPDPYIKMSLQPGKRTNFPHLPHHGQEMKTSVQINTTCPSWPSEEFVFEGQPSDVLEFEVKDKFAKSRPTISRFLGKLTVPVQRLIDKASQGAVTLTFNLMRRNPSDNVSGLLVFTVEMNKQGRKRGRSKSRQLRQWKTSDSSPSHSPHHQKVQQSNSLPSTLQNGHVLEQSFDDDADDDGGDDEVYERDEVMETSQSVGDEFDDSIILGDAMCAGSSNIHTVPTIECTQRITASSGSTDDAPVRQDVTSEQPGNDILPGDVPPPLPPRRYRMKVAGDQAEHHMERSSVSSTSSGQEAQVHLDDSVDLDKSDSHLQYVAEMAPSRPSRPTGAHIVVTAQTFSQESSSPVVNNRPHICLPITASLSSATKQMPPVETGGVSSDCCLPSMATVHDNDGEDIAGVEAGVSLGTDNSTQARPLSHEDDPAENQHVVQQELENWRHQHALSVDSPPPTPPPRDRSDRLVNVSSGKPPPPPPRDQSSLSTSQLNISTALTSAVSATVVPPAPPPRDASSMMPQGQQSESQQMRVLPSPRSKDNWRRTQQQAVTSDGNSSSTSGGSVTHLTSIGESRRAQAYTPVEPQPGEEPLPRGWEARIDSHGRVFYIDHINRTTTWQRPRVREPAQRTPSISTQDRQQFDRRYESIRRTMSHIRADAIEMENEERVSRTGAMSGTNTPATVSSIPEHVTPGLSPTSVIGSTTRLGHCSSQTPSGSVNTSYSGSTPLSSTTTPSSSSRQLNNLMQLPAVKFLTRPDLFTHIQNHERAFAEYNHNSTLKHMINKIRRDPNFFSRYQHNRDLVAFVNMFSDSTKEMPEGWEMKFDRSRKPFFIDHTSRSTTFIDPRLPTENTLLHTGVLSGDYGLQHTDDSTERSQSSHSASAGESHRVTANTHSVPQSYNEKVLLFLRQPNIMDVMKAKQPAISHHNSSLRTKVNAIREHGIEMLERLSNDVELIILLSTLENDIMSYVPPHLMPEIGRSPRGSPQGSPTASPGIQRANMRVPVAHKRDFQAKLRAFHRKLENKGLGQGPNKIKLTVHRERVLEDGFTKISALTKKELQKSKLYIMFQGEEGLDYGGPSREFFFLISRDLFNPYYGLFEYSANDTYTVQISPLSVFVDNYHEWFRFAGRIIALALIHQYLLDVFFTRPFYKALLRIPPSLSDLESLDAVFHQSLQCIKDSDITDMGLDLTFSVNEEVFGQITERELKPNGKNIAVTERNKKEYIERIVRWRVVRGVSEQTECLVRGFYEVIDPRIVSIFDARELELVIAGTVEIDIADWRRNTEYRSGYHDQHTVIQWFWNAVEKYDNDRRLRLLQFVTGTSSIPYEGFSALRGSNGPRKFCIEKWGKITSLPRAHTCFNRVDLPPYTSFEMLFEKLSIAVEETSTFGME